MERSIRTGLVILSCKKGPGEPSIIFYIYFACMKSPHKAAMFIINFDTYIMFWLEQLASLYIPRSPWLSEKRKNISKIRWGKLPLGRSTRKERSPIDFVTDLILMSNTGKVI